MRRAVGALGTTWLVAAATLLMVASLASLVRSLRSLDELEPQTQAFAGAVDRRVVAWERGLGELERREQLRGWVAGEIRRANPGVDAEKAHGYSRLLVEMTDKYTTIDPLFLLAIGIVESHFEPGATSHANAMGLYQIWPPTGRWLAAELEWSFSEAMLYDPEKNTELAALYVHKLFASYEDPRLVLAEYNGGPVNARRLRDGSDRLAAETREYVVKVLTVLDGLQGRYDLPSGALDDPEAVVRLARLEPLHESDAVAE